MIDISAPAIIQPSPLVEVRFELSYAVSRTEADRFSLPRDHRGATLSELVAYLPSDLRTMPAWALQSMVGVTPMVLLAMGVHVPGPVTTFLTTTSASDQTYSVPAAFISNTSVEVVSAGGDGYWNGSLGTVGGSGGYALKNAVSMTPGGTKTFRLRAHGVGTGAAAACWFGATSLAGSVVGIESAGNASDGVNGTGAVTTGGTGDTVTAGNDPVSSAGVDPPAAAQTARTGSGVESAGFGGGYEVGLAHVGVQGIIKIINLQ